MITESQVILVKERLKQLPKDTIIHILSRPFSISELINEVERRTEAGKVIVEQQLAYMKYFKR